MIEKVRLTTVLFDMDGVLVDVSRSYRRAIEETVEHFTGRQILPGTIQRYKNAGGFNDDWKLTHAIISDTGMSVPFSRVVSEFQRRYRGDNWDGFIAEEPSLITTTSLDKLCTDGRVLGIVTGRPQDEARWSLNNFGWKRYFPLLVAREKHEGRFKPDPYPLQHALAVLDAAGRHVSPHQCVYVGDTVDDMEAARAADMWAVGIVPPYIEDAAGQAEILRERGAHHVIFDTNGMTDVVERLHEFITPEAPLENEA
ncbi:MAG: TIGR01548 family HAD-type hydrolase [Bacteroidota bacterium]